MASVVIAEHVTDLTVQTFDTKQSLFKSKGTFSLNCRQLLILNLNGNKSHGLRPNHLYDS